MMDNIKKFNFSKPVLNLEEACAFTGISKSSMYKHTHYRTIPHYKPHGKLLYFKKADLELWMLQNRVDTIEEIEIAAGRI